MPKSDEFIFEPFRYFEKQAQKAPFPIRSLLPDFRDSGVFPTVFEDNLHYNEAGHEIAAKAIARHLVEDGLIEGKEP